MSSGPAHRVSSGVEVYGFPQGHIGHLTDEEELALQEFKELCTEKGLYKGPKDDEYGTYDDATLLCVQSLGSPIAPANVLCRRFLRARRFHVEDAFQQFKHTEEWREATQLDVIYDTIDLDQYEQTRRLVRRSRPTRPISML